MSESPERTVTVAVASDPDGRSIFVSLEGSRFVEVSHFPGSSEEAESMARSATGGIVGHEELVAIFGDVALMNLHEAR